MFTMFAFNNPELSCIMVDDENAIYPECFQFDGWCKDSTASYSEFCELGTEDFTITDFQLYPNPTENILNIQSKENIENVKIYSTQGILVKEDSSKTVDVSQLSAGMYFVKIYVEGKGFTKKFIKL
ncbi:MAG: T9SS type A sorting domain-containing protein [Flavobacteriaceae bacterium]|nr:T9SS type A sorting domain-containing protein [Flavobacteriaceae bacterium]